MPKSPGLILMKSRGLFISLDFKIKFGLDFIKKRCYIKNPKLLVK